LRLCPSLHWFESVIQSVLVGIETSFFHSFAFSS
jgi:hypothetical protein